jgi:4-amino-4-deoxy-L-arabinose transferase-like glycosyltransferase
VPQIPRFAWRPVGLVTAALLLLLALTANGYGYHRDELYFRLLGAHPAWGYVDEPPLTPLLIRASTALFGDNLVALRVPAIVCATLTAVITALIARELGGGAVAQALAAAGVSSTFLLVAGHVMLTASPDMVVWTLVILFACRALLREQPRWWLAAGLTVGAGLYNKQLVVLLLIGLAAGLLIAGPRRELRSPWLWTGVAVALVVGAPNLVYQATHHWPELAMSKALARNKGHDARLFFVPLQLVLLGFPAMVIWVAGLVRLLRDQAWRPVRALAWAYPVACVLTLVSGGQAYYTFGLLAFLFAAGCVVTARWAGRRRGRWAWTLAGLAVSEAVAVVVALPVIPLSALGATPVPAINQAARDSVGWPAYVRQVAAVVAGLPAADAARAVLLTGNYGEAGALDRYGPRYHLPPVYSGQNELYHLGPPPDSARVVVAVGLGLSFLDSQFAGCTRVGAFDNGVGVDNEEQGNPIAICREPRRPWRDLWPNFQHYD